MNKDLKKHLVGMNKEFRFRGEEQSRIETVSDAGFALAIGLLLISVSTPNTFKELLDFTNDLIPFAMCITLIMLVWYQHFIFFLRYGLKNARIVALNTILLFIILFYVYPLKFLAKVLSLIYGGLLKSLFHSSSDSQWHQLSEMIASDKMPNLMIIYGLGATSIFVVLVFMYQYAYQKAGELNLNIIERFDTKASIYSNTLMASVPLLSVILALIIPEPIAAATISGFTYWLYIPIMIFFGRKMKKKRSPLLADQHLPL